MLTECTEGKKLNWFSGESVLNNTDRTILHWPHTKVSTVRAVYNWMLKIIRNNFGFAFLRSVIGLEISRHQLNQIIVKPKLIATCHTRFLALGVVYVYLLRVFVGSFCICFDWSSCFKSETGPELELFNSFPIKLFEQSSCLFLFFYRSVTLSK